MNLSPSLPGGWAAVGIPAVQIAVVVAVTAAAALRLRRAGWRRVVWQAGLVCVALLVLELVTGFGREVYQRHRREARNTPPPVTEVVPVPVTAAPVDVSAPAITGEHVDNEAFDAPVTVNDAVPIADAMPAFEVPAETKQSLPLLIDTKPVVSVETEVTPVLPWWVLLVWVLGAVGVTARILAARWHLLRLGGAARDTLDTAVYERAQSLAGRLGMRHRVRVIETDHVHAPIVYGLLRPTLAVPARWTEDFDGRQREAMLAHELAHLAAHDPAWYLFTDIVTAMLWWHPAVWWARAQLHAASEIAADEASLLLVNGPDTLAECLVQLARQWVEARRDAGIGVEGDEFRSRLGRRVERLLALDGQRWQPLSRARAFGVQAGVPLLLLVVILLTTGWMVPGWLATRGPSFQSVLDRLAVLTLVERPPQKTKLPVPSTKTDVAAADAAIPAASLKPTGDVRTNSTETTAEQKALEAKLDQIVIQQIFYPTLPLPEVLKDLSRQVERADPDKRGLNIFVNRYLGVSDDPAKTGLWRLAGAWDPQTVFVRIEPPVKNLTLRQALDRICRATDQAVTWHLEDYGIEIIRKDLPLFKPAQNISSTVPVDEAQRQRLALFREMPVKSFFVPNLPLPEVIHDLRKRLSKNDATLGFKFRLRDRNGVEVPPGGAGQWDPHTVFVEIDPPLQNLRMTDVLDAVAKGCDLPVKVLFEGDTIIFQDNSAAEKSGAAFPLVDAFGNPLGPPPAVLPTNGVPLSSKDLLPVPNPFLRTNVGNSTTVGRAAILAKLENIRFDEVHFPNVPFTEVLKKLDAEVRKKDPEGKGLNFILNPFLDNLPGAPGVAGGRPKLDFSTITVEIDPPLRDLRLLDVLQVVCRSASQPVKYVVEDYAVTFVPKGAEPAVPLTRIFKVDPSTFIQGLENVQGAPVPGTGNQNGNNAPTFPRVAPVPNGNGNGAPATKGGRPSSSLSPGQGNKIRDYFAARGLDFGTNQADRFVPQIHFNDQNGSVLVRAEPKDMTLIERELGSFGVLKARMEIELQYAQTKHIETNGFYFNGIATRAVTAEERQARMEGFARTNGAAFKRAPELLTEDRKMVSSRLDPGYVIEVWPTNFGSSHITLGTTVTIEEEVTTKSGFERQQGKVTSVYSGQSVELTVEVARLGAPTVTERIYVTPYLLTPEGKRLLPVPEPPQALGTVTWKPAERNFRSPVTTASQLGAPEVAHSLKTNAAPPEVQIEVRFVDLPVSKLASAGLQPFTVAGLAGLRATNAQTVTLRPTEQTNRVMKTTPVATVSAVLSVEQAGELLARLEKTKEVNITQSPAIRSRFGERAIAAVQDETSVVVGMKVVTNSAGKSIQTQSKPFRLGPEITVRPALGSEDKVMQLATALRFTEFLGYEDPREHPEEARTVSAGYEGLKAQVPLPLLREHSVQDNYLLRDGQTLLISGEALAGQKPKGSKEARRLFILMTAKQLGKDGAAQVRETSLEQAPPMAANLVKDEAARRAESMLEIRRLIAEAQRVQKEKRNTDMATLYEQALRLVDRLGGVGVQSERVTAIQGLEEARLAVAKEAFRHGDFDEATKQMDQLLKFDPENKAGKQFRKYNVEVQAGSKGRRPSQEVVAKIPEYLARKADTSQLVQDGKLLFEMRLLDEAEAKLKAALAQAPDNMAAYYYLNLIQEARYGEEARKRDFAQKTRLMEVEKAWTIDLSKGLPTPSPYMRTNLPTNGSKSRQAILAKLDDIKVDTLSYQKKPLPDVLSDLDRKAKEADPSRKGVNFIINRFMEDLPVANRGAATPALTDAFGAPLAGINPPAVTNWNPLNVLITIDPPVRGLTLEQALKTVVKSANTPIKYIVEDYAVVFTEWAPEAPPMYTKIFKVDPTNFVAALERQAGIVPIQSFKPVETASVSMQRNECLRHCLEAAGLDLGPTNRVGQAASPATAAKVYPQVLFNDRNGTLLVRASMADLEIIQGVIEFLNQNPVGKSDAPAQPSPKPGAPSDQGAASSSAGRTSTQLKPPSPPAAKSEHVFQVRRLMIDRDRWTDFVVAMDRFKAIPAPVLSGKQSVRALLSGDQVDYLMHLFTADGKSNLWSSARIKMTDGQIIELPDGRKMTNGQMASVALPSNETLEIFPVPQMGTNCAVVWTWSESVGYDDSFPFLNFVSISGPEPLPRFKVHSRVANLVMGRFLVFEVGPTAELVNHGLGNQINDEKGKEVLIVGVAD